MTDEVPEKVEQPARGPLERIQDILGELDTDAMVLGFVLVAEWLEPNGGRALSVIHTEQSPWNLHGMLTYARDQHVGPDVDYEFIRDADDEDGDFAP